MSSQPGLRPDLAQRIAAHTHIKGLGVSDDLKVVLPTSGFVGQEEARKACSIVVDLIKEKKFAGKAILLAGAPGTGKTALALSISHGLGKNVPFCPMVGSEVFSSEVPKTEILRSHFRRAIGLRIKEIKDIFEGEVTALTPVEGEQQLHGYGRQISHVILSLKSTAGQKTLKLDPSIYESITREKIKLGDVIYLESTTGAIKRLGRCSNYITETDMSGDRYVPLPVGSVFKKKEIIQELTLHDLDMANARPTGENEILSVIQGLGSPRKTEITNRLRSEVNRIVSKYIESGVCEVVPGVLFIDEVHMLDADCHAFLNSALEQPIAPVVICATNKGIVEVRGTNQTSPHGLPPDLLDRMLIIRTMPYSKEEIHQILVNRAREESIDVERAAMQHLATIGFERSLRYAMQLLGPSRIFAERKGRKSILLEDIVLTASLFLDSDSSAAVLSEGADRFLK